MFTNTPGAETKKKKRWQDLKSFNISVLGVDHRVEHHTLHFRKM